MSIHITANGARLLRPIQTEVLPTKEWLVDDYIIPMETCLRDADQLDDSFRDVICFYAETDAYGSVYRFPSPERNPIFPNTDLRTNGVARKIVFGRPDFAEQYRVGQLSKRGEPFQLTVYNKHLGELALTAKILWLARATDQTVDAELLY